MQSQETNDLFRIYAMQMADIRLIHKELQLPSSQKRYISH